MIDLATFRETARTWLASADIPAVPLGLDERFEVLRGWQRELFTAGWIGISWTKEAGGQGLTPLHQLAFNEELARAGAPTPVGLIGLEVVGPSIERYGSQWQRRDLLPRLLSGDDIWCQGFSEPEAGSDLASLRTRGEIGPGTLRINGQKVWTSWANQASWCALLVRTDPEAPRHKGISYVLVNMKSPGISVRPLTQMTGDQEFCEVFFDDVLVPLENVVGELHGGWRIANHTLSAERGSYAARRRVEYEVAVGEAVQEVNAYLRGPDTPPAAAFDRVTAALGRAYVATRALDGQTRQTIRRLVADVGPTAEDSVDKLLLNDVEQTIYTTIIDLLGPGRLAASARPFGLDAERWVHDHYYSRAVSIYGGTSQIQRNIIAQRLIGLPRA
jgi:alkylation response protein AidB-like acyl-CoA dehydrogenase